MVTTLLQTAHFLGHHIVKNLVVVLAIVMAESSTIRSITPRRQGVVQEIVVVATLSGFFHCVEHFVSEQLLEYCGFFFGEFHAISAALVH